MKAIRKATVQNLLAELQSMVDCKQEQLGGEESKDYPNEERLELLESQLQSLENALEALQEYEF